jgi:hypothetical protein
MTMRTMMRTLLALPRSALAVMLVLKKRRETGRG